MTMTSSRPYLLRALYEWILDNNSVPHILVNVAEITMTLPKEYVEEDTVVLDISPDAARDLIVSNEAVEFRARFAGNIRHIYLPMESIMAIYNEEGIGMFFEGSEADIWEASESPFDSTEAVMFSIDAEKKPSSDKTAEKKTVKKKKGHLKLIK